MNLPFRSSPVVLSPLRFSAEHWCGLAFEIFRAKCSTQKYGQANGAIEAAKGGFTRCKVQRAAICNALNCCGLQICTGEQERLNGDSTFSSCAVGTILVSFSDR